MAVDETPDGDAASEARPCVLLVEDEALIRILTSDMLDVLGCDVAEAGGAAEAMQIVDDASQPLTAALVDLGLPDRPGDQLIGEIRTVRPELPIIVATGRGAGDLPPQVRDLAALAVLEKPYDLEQLEAALAGVDAV